MKTLFKSILMISILVLAVPALAKPVLKINLKAEKEMVEQIDGKEVREIVPADEIFSGETIIYTLNVVNSGDQPATNVKVNDPIPKETALIIESVYGDDADITFSINDGKSYNKPTLLKYRMKNKDGTFDERVATPEQYTNIQWVLETVPAGSTRTVGFKALVK